MSEENNQVKSVFNAMPSKTSFFVGMVSGIMAFCTLGFIVVLVGGMDLSKLGLRPAGSGFGAKPGAVANTNGAVDEPTQNFDKMPPIDPATDHIRGDINKAKVALVEYSDYECPFCKRFHASVVSALKDYGTDVAWVYRHFPLSFHANAQKQAEASECVAELGGNDAFWKFSDLLYERTTSNGTGFALDKLGPLAKEVGVNQAKFQTCLDSGKYAAKVNSDMAGGSGAGVEGTPGTIVISKEGETTYISGAQDESVIKSSIDSLLK
jgi:protein-disulfide isomerase